MAAAQSFVGPVDSRTYAGCSAGGCAFLEVRTGTPSGRYSPSGQPSVGPDWLGVAFALRVTLTTGSGFGLNTRWTPQVASGTLSIDPDERYMPGLPCGDADIRYVGSPVTCTSFLYPSNYVQGFVSPSFELGSAFVPVLRGTPGTFIDRVTAVPAGITLTATPEPPTFALAAAGVAVVIGVRRRVRA